MVTITGSDFKGLIQDASISDTNAEKIVDEAIDLLNLYGEDLDLSNLSGTAGSKTVAVTSKKRGAIYLFARAVYATFWMNASNANVGIGGLSVTLGEVMGNPITFGALKEAAQLLRERDWTRSII